MITATIALLVVWFFAAIMKPHSKNRFVPMAMALGLVCAWEVLRTDWVVETDCEYMGEKGHTGYAPPSSPLWHPPKPQEISPTAHSWNDSAFFSMGGAGEPTEEPYLRIDWFAVLLKIAFFTGAGYPVCDLMLYLYALSRSSVWR